MTINNDIITFEPVDIAQLSGELQTALDAYSAPKPVEVILSQIVNDALNRALAVRVNRRIGALKIAVSEATPEQKQQVDGLLTQAENILFVKEEEPEPKPVDNPPSPK